LPKKKKKIIKKIKKVKVKVKVKNLTKAKLKNTDPKQLKKSSNFSAEEKVE